ncbi:MAG: four helix bundle protein [Bacteroidota bacterium]|jgi:four helix bundle protein|nr:four helix bundle protein [Bacteroidota bacterium]
MSQELEERFLSFAKRVRDFCRTIKWDVQYIKQLIRSSSSIGANYIEASDDLGKQDEIMKIRISRREAKESIYWLKLISNSESKQVEEERMNLIDEGNQIQKILSSILIKLNNKIQ